MGYLDGAKQQMLERAAGQITPSEHPVGQAFATVLVELENEQAAALNRGLEAADVDARAGVDPDDRRDQLLDLADAVAQQDVEEWWWSDVAPKRLDNADKARSYVGLEEHEWHEQLRAWYHSYYEAGVVDDPLDTVDPAQIGEVADRHVRETFGVPLRTFVEDVINWSPARVGQSMVAGPFRQHTQLIRVLATRLEEQNRRIAELEQRLDDGNR